MNDVLPKPFTKEGLLSMLEKHLGHLKRLPDGMEPMVTQPSVVQTSVSTSLKDETSPADSPSTMSNWQSPGQYAGISPTQGAPSQSYMQPLHSAGAYSSDQSPMSYHAPHTPIGGQPQMPHPRQISELGQEEMRTEQGLPMGQMQPGRAV